MAIVIQKLDGFYGADLTPPHGSGEVWSTSRPMSRDELIAELRGQGCHETDIGDAFYQADPEWLLR